MRDLTAIKNELKAIQGRRTLLPATDVVEWAKSHPKSELHKEFEWNVNKAAEEHWLWQARQLIKLVIEVPDVRPTWVSLSIDRTKEDGGYRIAEQVKRTPELREILVRDVVKELGRIRSRYFDLERELGDVFAAIDVAVEKYAPEEQPVAAD